MSTFGRDRFFLDFLIPLCPKSLASTSCFFRVYSFFALFGRMLQEGVILDLKWSLKWAKMEIRFPGSTSSETAVVSTTESSTSSEDCGCANWSGFLGGGGLLEFCSSYPINTTLRANRRVSQPTQRGYHRPGSYCSNLQWSG